MPAVSLTYRANMERAILEAAALGERDFRQLQLRAIAVLGPSDVKPVERRKGPRLVVVNDESVAGDPGFASCQTVARASRPDVVGSLSQNAGKFRHGLLIHGVLTSAMAMSPTMPVNTETQPQCDALDFLERQFLKSIASDAPLSGVMELFCRPVEKNLR